MRHLNYLAIGFVLLLSITSRAQAQEDQKILVNEYFWGSTLQEVVTVLVDKYHLKIDYSPEDIEGLAFDYLFIDATPTESMNIICNHYPKLGYYQDEFNVFHLGIKTEMSKTTEIANSKYDGSSKQSNIRVSGIVQDAKSGESIPFATVMEVGTANGGVSNEEGYFTLFNVTTDTATIEVSSIGYKNTRLFLSPDMDLKNLILTTEPLSIDLGEIVVEAERDELMRISDKVSVATMSPKKISKLPNAGEKDIFRSFQLLPGVSGSNEASSGLYVRGGTPDQNLILYDGFTVYHVDHLFGMFSAFNSNAVKDVELYKGGFESKFGGRISSVMNIVGKDGNENEFNIGGDIGLLSINGYVEIPIENKVTILLAARRSWQSPLYSSIFESFSTAETSTTSTGGFSGRAGGRAGGKQVRREEVQPSSFFYDLNGKVSYKPNSKDILSLSFFHGVDNIDNSREFTGLNAGSSFGATNDLTRWGNWGTSANWSRKWNDVFYSYSLLSISNYFSQRDRTRTVTIVNEEEEEIESVRGTKEENQLYDLSAKWNNEWKLTKNHQLEFGLQSTYYNINYDYSLNDTITIQDRLDKGFHNSLYLQDHWSIRKRFTFIPGIRLSHFNVTNDFYVEPRLSLSYNVTKRLKLKSAWGHYYQTVARIIRNDLSSGSRDFWVLADDESVPVGFAEHFILGASYETTNYIFDVEGYYKRMTGLSEYSLQFTPTFTNVDFDEFFYEGTGYSRGIEFLAQKKYGDYTGWAGYTIGEVVYDFDVFGGQFYANQDVTHEFKLVQNYELKNWTFAATWIFATGKPYTDASSSYEVTLLDGSTQDFINLDDKNAARYPAYHRLDVAATRDFTFGDESSGSLSFSIFNLYNRQNIWYREFAVDGDELVVTDVTLLGFTPNVTLSLKLR